MGHIVSVFPIGIRSVFLGIYHTDTEGKFGQHISVSKRGQCPPFPQKGGNGPLFEKLQPLLEKRGEERGEVYEKGGDRYRPKYRKSSKSDTGKLPIPKKTAVTPRYTTLEKTLRQKTYGSNSAIAHLPSTNCFCSSFLALMGLYPTLGIGGVCGLGRRSSDYHLLLHTGRTLAAMSPF